MDPHIKSQQQPPTTPENATEKAAVNGAIKALDNCGSKNLATHSTTSSKDVFHKRINLSISPLPFPSNNKLITSAKQHLKLIAELEGKITEIETQGQETSKKARQFGYQQGYQEGLEQAKLDLAFGNLEAEIAEYQLIPNLLGSLIPKFEQIVKYLCREVLACELRNCESFALPRVQRIIQSEQFSETIQLRLSTKCEESQIEYLKEKLTGTSIVKIEIAKDPDLDKNELRIQTSKGNILLSPENHLERLTEVLGRRSSLTDGFYRDIVIRELLEFIK